MRFWLLVGLLSAAAIPVAAASEDSTECGLDTRRVVQEEAAVTVQPLTPPESRKAQRTLRNAADASAAQRPAVRTDARRRGGSQLRIPDAMLIDGRGAL